MASELKELSPQIKLGDKLVQVGLLDWTGIESLCAALETVDLPMPKLVDGSSYVEALLDNLVIVKQWLVRCPQIAKPLIFGASNLTPELLGQLSATQVVRVIHAAVDNLVADGFFTELRDFFVGLLPKATAPPPAAADPGETESPPSAAPTSAPAA